jgi:hypothetical protein
MKNITDKDSKNIWVNSLLSVLIKGGGIAVTFFTMPALMDYFKDERILGIWFTMLSVLSWILTFDIGIGNGLRNKLVHATVKNDRDMISRCISAAYLSTGIITAVILVIAAVIFPAVNWNFIFNIQTDVISAEILRTAAAITFMGIMSRFFLGLISSVLFALQKSALNNFMIFVSNFLMLLFVLSANRLSFAGDLTVMAAASAIINALPLFIATVIIFSTSLKESRPSLKSFDKGCAAGIIRLGGMFFWIHIMYMLIFTSNEFLITWLSSSENVVEYQIYNRLFALASTFFFMALTPVWSAVTKAVSEEKYEWLGRLHKKLIWAGLLGTALKFAVIPIAEPIMRIWLGDRSAGINYEYAAGFAVMGSCMIWCATAASVSNGMGRLKTQAVCYTAGVIAKFPAAWLLCGLTGSWIGIVWANALVLLPFAVAQQIINRKNINSMKIIKIDSKGNK